MTAVSARNLTLKEVHRLFGFQKQYDGSFSDLLSLETLTEPEKQELLKIRDDFEPYLAEGQALEGQIRIVVVAPLLRLAGFCFYNYPIQIKVENNIAPLDIQDEDISITGRSDIIAINKDKQTTTNVDFWILVLETKPTLASTLAGLPQILTYAYTSLKQQKSVWGLVTNGLSYEFLYIQSGNPPSYLHLPILNLF
ncbi:MAG: type I restriction enzyme HsdR N-terminal domain-containing protein [Kamptonema sp. SIO1D9]|nr:type I restriction enzyme HsdR N-terminal domain-containing protein [Kamptonema sp. SIO1D9]